LDALTSILRALALERMMSTRIANTEVVKPVAAGLLEVLLFDEPVTASLLIGLAAVFAGIRIATTTVPNPRQSRLTD
jgi:drug/metabolite transporter (DMT)-like permease